MALIKISQGNDLLYETWANGEGNITSLASAIRTVQKESNDFLSKLVDKEKASNNTEKKSGDGNAEDEEEDEESEDDANKEEKTDTKEVEPGKKRNISKSSPNSKKFCSNK